MFKCLMKYISRQYIYEMKFNTFDSWHHGKNIYAFQFLCSLFSVFYKYSEDFNLRAEQLPGLTVWEALHTEGWGQD